LISLSSVANTALNIYWDTSQTRFDVLYLQSPRLKDHDHLENMQAPGPITYGNAIRIVAIHATVSALPSIHVAKRPHPLEADMGGLQRIEVYRAGPGGRGYFLADIYLTLSLAALFAPLIYIYRTTNRADTLSRAIDGCDLLHQALKDCVKDFHRFASDYPHIRHAQNRSGEFAFSNNEHVSISAWPTC
jgi:hypothetical protein